MLEIDEPELGSLDTHSIILGAHEPASKPPTLRGGSSIVWQGPVEGDGTGPRDSYYVRLLADGRGYCSCPDFYFRGLLRRLPAYRCKHLVRAWAAHGPSGGRPQVS
jgi:hypothetical protein